jgi:hypothetical protein
VWVLNITITVIYTLVGVVGAVGSFKLIIEVSPGKIRHPLCLPGLPAVAQHP